MKKILIVFLSLCLLWGCTKKEESCVKDVVVHTYVSPGGQFVESITCTVDDMNLESISKDDYTFNGKATGWMDNKEKEFSASIEDIQVNGNQLTFIFKEFPKKYFYVTQWQMVNNAIPELSVNSSQVNKVITPVADEFETYEEDFTYHLYTPKTEDNLLPLVLVFHGFSDTNNLLAYRTSINWAKEEAQSIRPCFVLSPVIEDAIYFDGEKRDAVYPKIYHKIQSLIQEGKVDSKRIYVMGNSFGGMATFEFSEKYPDFVSAMMPLCAALNYSDTALKNLDKITHIPMWIFHALNDNTIPSSYSKQAYDTLIELGSKEVQLTIYSDEEMNAVGGSSNPNSTYSYHHVELAVMEDDNYATWLFSQIK